jgi:di/tricarboxylate transporter
MVAIILFATEWIRMDMVSLMVLLALGSTGLVSVEEAFSGFSNPAVITVAAMFIISMSISNTGAVQHLGEKILTLTGNSEPRLIVAIMGVVALFSAFINNIGATAILLPVVVSMAKKANLPPSKLLMPLAFGSLLGGVCTLIGTPPNILMNELLQQYTGEKLSMFDFTPVGIVVLLTGILYMAFIGYRFLPTRKSGTLTEAYQVKEFTSEVEVEKGSPLAGVTLAHAGLEDFSLTVRAIMRGELTIPQPRRNQKLHEGDILFLAGEPKSILQIRKKKGLQLIPERDNPLPPFTDKEIAVVEATLTPTSNLAGKTLREIRFADVHGLTVLALWRSGEPIVKKVDHVPLKFGDVLLLQGAEEKVRHLGLEHGFLLMGGVKQVSYNPQKAPLALGILVTVVLTTALGFFPIMLSATFGALAMILTNCTTSQEAYESIDWSIIILIAGTLPLGLAMEKSGAAKLIADFIIGKVGPMGPWYVLAAVFFITFCLTEVMSHAAAAVLVAPIAFNTAVSLQVSPKPFFIAVAIAASSCFMTPISHQTNALVMGPGGYKFFDYTKVGTPLNILIWVIAVLIIPLFFPFN